MTDDDEPMTDDEVETLLIASLALARYPSLRKLAKRALKESSRDVTAATKLYRDWRPEIALRDAAALMQIISQEMKEKLNG